jgi:ketosteroid isomerase-like protein
MMRLRSLAMSVTFLLSAAAPALWYTLAQGDPVSAPAVAPDLAALAAEVLELDRDFAAVAGEHGLRVAYERYLAADATVFRPLPVVAREWLATHEPASGQLAWTPGGATLACDGSLALTSGTWTYTTGPGAAGESGQYLTAWRREPTGDWRIVLDQSITGAGATARDVAGTVAADTCPRREADLRALRAADERVGTQVRGRNAAGAEVVVPVRAVPTGTVVGSPAGDVALTHGELVAKRRVKRGADQPVVAVYVRVWSRGDSGWQLQRDLVTPVGATGD